MDRSSFANQIVLARMALRSSEYSSIFLRVQAATVRTGSKALLLALSSGLSDDTKIEKSSRAAVMKGDTSEL